jgi:DNA-binding HxlR family transcriptional regulator
MKHQAGENTETATTKTTAPDVDVGAPSVARMVEDIVGCKWSLSVIDAVRHGVQRPGAIEHRIEGLSKKVLAERLAKLVRYGIVERTAFAEVPPRVEYTLTAFGARFVDVLDRIDALQRELGR